jgi:hypothetical protein
MGTFFAEALLAAPERPERREPVTLLVDSGSTYTWVAAPLLRALSVGPTERRRVVTIEGQPFTPCACSAVRATSTC